jgi:glycosyltransferase involved in cell wall biosynthesis
VFSVVIPSRNIDNLSSCMQAVCRCEPEARIIVIDDGLEGVDWPRPIVMRNGNGSPYPSTEIRMGIKPFSFPRNVNLGIRAAGDDDVVLCNDDALLQTPGGFSLLAREAEAHSEYGIISATTNVAGNPSQSWMGVGLRDEPRTVAFVCVYIPRRTIETVGLMDERFGGTAQDGRRIYGFCDNDMCRRIRNAGLKIGIHDGCFVDHGSLRSEFRGDPRAAADISAAGELYTEKWGDWL